MELYLRQQRKMLSERQTTEHVQFPVTMTPELGAITDILLSGDFLGYDDLTLPGSDIPFNSCSSIPSHPIYWILVHESGHVLGIREGTAYPEAWPRDAFHHSTIRGSVMNYYNSDKDCSPHPFDIMAIYALYQSPVRVEPN